MATLLENEIEHTTGVRVMRGLLNKPGMLDSGDRLKVDDLMPDYGILGEVEYDYGLKDSYLIYATRGHL